MRSPLSEIMHAASLSVLGTGLLALVLSTVGCGARTEKQNPTSAPNSLIPAEQQAGQQAAQRAAQQGAAMRAARQAYPNGQ